MSETTQGELNRRNTETMSKKLEDMNQRIYAQDTKIKELINTLGTFAARVQSLEMQLMTFKVRSVGTGPSVIE